MTNDGPKDFAASLAWLRTTTASKALPQLLIASAYWSAWFWSLFERSTQSPIPIVIWFAAGLVSTASSSCGQSVPCQRKVHYS
jgi:hypothetical protein